MKNNQNYINHIALVLDASSSMYHLVDEVVKVADNQIKYLAQRSKDLDQETRVTVYTFSDNYNIQCLIYDKDVLRMPSISGLYKPQGMTALIDATSLAVEDLATTPEKYGEHAFLIYVLTDGQENDSKKTGTFLADKIKNLPDNFTLAAFVPDQDGVFEAKRIGFPKENIAVWDTSSTKGVEEAGKRIRETTEIFMQYRARGVRSTKNLFTMEAPPLEEIKENLDSLHPGQYRLYDVEEDGRIDEFVESKTHRPYVRGEAYYQLMKKETIQPQKQIAILANHTLYIGDQARDLLGLPDHNIKVAPGDHPDYEIFVQSTSNNRKLIGGTKLLILS